MQTHVRVKRKGRGKEEGAKKNKEMDHSSKTK
jgi:hypothetical protein